MSENSLITIRNGAIASIIAGSFLLAVPLLRRYFVSFLFWLWSGAVWSWKALFSSYALPGWSWVILFVFTAIGLGNTFFALKGKSKHPEHASYAKDFLFNLKWRWTWVNDRITDLWCFCPTCDATLVYNDSSCRDLYNPVNKTDFICENCNHHVVATIRGGEKDYAISAVRREFERRIRTGEYKIHCTNH